MKNSGQAIITGISGLELQPQEKDFIEQENIGGVILFSKNYQDPRQLRKLTSEIKSLKTNYPLFISVDHEGGRVIRFKNTFTHFPPMLSIARYKDPELFSRIALVMGEELVSCGINLNFSPCCDLYTNAKNQVIGDRAFGTSPREVNGFIDQFIKGLDRAKILSCAKHFPGHGDTFEDSHLELPLVKTSLEILRRREFLPFQQAIQSGVDAMMMAHLLVEEIDPKLPCSLSSQAYAILREELGFKGIIFTDDMQMSAIFKNFSVTEAANLALSAGADCLIYRDMECARIALAGIKPQKDSMVRLVEFKNKKLRYQENFETPFEKGRRILEEMQNRMV